ncbi:LPXTG cell wall anchor domain-containing protein [Staphylococcus haemolyticus]
MSKKQGNHNSTNAQSSLPETGHSDSEQSIQLLGSIFLLLGGALVAKQSHKKSHRKNEMTSKSSRLFVIDCCSHSLQYYLFIVVFIVLLFCILLYTFWVTFFRATFLGL